MMPRILKYIIALPLCLLVAGGTAGVRFYVHSCSHNHCSVRLALHSGEECSHQEQKECCGDGEEHPARTSAPLGINPQSCCSTNIQNFVLPSYELQDSPSKKHCSIFLCSHLPAASTHPNAFGTQAHYLKCLPPPCPRPASLGAPNIPLRL